MKKEEKIINFEFELCSEMCILHWKFENDNQCKQIVNPTVKDIEPLLKYKMFGKSKNDLLYLTTYINQLTLKKEN